MNISGKFLLLILALYSHFSYAQKRIIEAVMMYKITTGPSSDKVAMSGTLEGAAFTVYLKANQSRTDMVTALGTESNYYDSKLEKGVILKLYSGQKLMISLTKDNWNQKNKSYQNMKFVIDNVEQTIAGLKCKKATGQSPDGKSFVVYFAPDIALVNTKYENAFPQLPGLPVQYEIQSGKLIFRYTLNNINYDPVQGAAFEIPAAGFRVMTYEENQRLRTGEN